MSISSTSVPIRRARSFGPFEACKKERPPPSPFPATSLPNIQVSSLLSLEEFPPEEANLCLLSPGRGKKGRQKGGFSHGHKPPKVLRKTWDKVKGIIHSGSGSGSGSSQKGAVKRPQSQDQDLHLRSQSPKTPESGRASPTTVQLHYLQLQRRLSQELHPPREGGEEEADWEVMWKASTGRVQYTEEELIKHLPEDFSRKWREWDGGIARRQRQRASQRSGGVIRGVDKGQGSREERVVQRVKEVREERKRVKEELRILEEEERSLMVEARLQGWKVEEEEPETEEEVSVSRSADITRSPSSLSASSTSTASEPQVSRIVRKELREVGTQTDTVMKVTAQEILAPEEEKLTTGTSSPVIVPTKRLIFSPVWDQGDGLELGGEVQGQNQGQETRSTTTLEVMEGGGDSGSSSPALRVRRDREALGVPHSVPKMGLINVPPWCSPLLGGRRGRGAGAGPSGGGALRPSRSFRKHVHADASNHASTSAGPRENPAIPTPPVPVPVPLGVPGTISSPGSPSAVRHCRGEDQGHPQGHPPPVPGKKGLYAQLKSKVVGSLAKSQSVGAMLKGNHHDV